MSMLLMNSTTAEIARGCVFDENFRSKIDIASNNGTIIGNPVIDFGITLNGETDYVTYTDGRFFNNDKLSIVMGFYPYFDTDSDDNYKFFDTDVDRNQILKRNNTYDNTLRISFGGTTIEDITEATYSPYWKVGQRNIIVVVSTSADTSVWLNGNIILSSDSTAWTPNNPTTLYVGASSTSAAFVGKISNFKIYHSLLSDQEVLDFCDKSTYEYRSNFEIEFPMLSSTHDPSNVSSTEELTDGDMEASDTTAWTAGNNATLSKQTTGQYEGSRSLRVAYSDTTDPYALQAVFSVGSRYNISGWARGDGTNYPYIKDGSSAVLWSGTNSINWQYFNVERKATTSNFWLVCDSNGWAEFDAISVKKLESRTLDISKNRCHGILGNGDVTNVPTKKRNQGYLFSTSYIDCGDVLNGGSGDFTIFGMAKSNAGSDYLVCKRLDASTGYRIATESTNELYFAIGDGTDTYLMYSTGDVVDIGIFSFICIVDRTLGDMRIYINGRDDSGSTTGTFGDVGDISSIGSKLLIGCTETYSNFWDGDVYQLGICYKALTPIQAIDLHYRMMMEINYV